MKNMRKIDRNINRRRFLKEGFSWAALAGLYPLVKLIQQKDMNSEPIPRKARHWRRLAG